MQPWKNVSLNLINNVKQGYCHTLPDSTPVVIANIIQKCWEHWHALRPSASEISDDLEQYIQSKLVETSSKVLQKSSFDKEFIAN